MSNVIRWVSYKKLGLLTRLIRSWDCLPVLKEAGTVYPSDKKPGLLTRLILSWDLLTRLIISCNCLPVW